MRETASGAKKKGRRVPVEAWLGLMMYTRRETKRAQPAFTALRNRKGVRVDQWEGQRPASGGRGEGHSMEARWPMGAGARVAKVAHVRGARGGSLAALGPEKNYS